MHGFEEKIRTVMDFPKPGIGFKDITTLLKDASAFKDSIEAMAAKFDPEKIDKILGIESRGFIFASVLAYKWNKGLIVARKPGKLPAEKISEEYELEYGVDRIEIHRDAISPGERILILDDLLATGGTVEATIKLVEQLKGEIAGIGFLIELTFLNGRKRFENFNICSLIEYDSE
ncbi:adenine phosphoribosyltransferase [candidate division KSB1 bacterium]|nr:adenine phosphoribosyltransferase [candidate division KSB1 bacterium]MBL7093185.1 adenine phosphoribosyltransferase [candidate division KSB1 bacterium]